MPFRNIILSAGLFALAVGALLLMWLLPAYVSVPVAAQYAPGPTPQSFPRILASVLVVGGIAAIVADVIYTPAQRKPSEYELNIPNLLFIVVAVFAYILLFQWIGFALSTFAFLMGFMWFFSPLGALWSMAVSFGVTAAIALVFSVMLKIPLPAFAGAV